MITKIRFGFWSSWQSAKMWQLVMYLDRPMAIKKNFWYWLGKMTNWRE